VQGRRLFVKKGAELVFCCKAVAWGWLCPPWGVLVWRAALHWVVRLQGAGALEQVAGAVATTYCSHPW
jgi:hypothetical protein